MPRSRYKNACRFSQRWCHFRCRKRSVLSLCLMCFDLAIPFRHHALHATFTRCRADLQTALADHILLDRYHWYGHKLHRNRWLCGLANSLHSASSAGLLLKTTGLRVTVWKFCPSPHNCFTDNTIKSQAIKVLRPPIMSCC